MNSAKKFVLVWLSAFALSHAAEAAVVYLRDGTQVRGSIVSATVNEIKIATEDRTVSVPMSRVLRIEYEDSTPAKTPTAAPPAPVDNEWQAHRPTLDDLRQMFSINLGLAVPISKIDFSEVGGGSANNGDSGFLAGFQYVYYANERLGWGADVEYFGRGPHGAPSLLPLADSSVEGDSLLMMAILRYTLTSHGSARPFVLLGAGTNRTSTAVDSQPNLGFAWSDTNTDETRRVIDDTTWGLSTTARVGIDFNFMQPSLISIEMGWTGLYNGRPDPTPAGRDLGLTGVTGNLDALMFDARFGWRF